MSTAHRARVFLPAICLVAAVLAVGCRDHMPHAATWWGGDVSRTHAEPAEGGYYENWDPYAVKVELEPDRAVNPVRSQHVLIATVLDAKGEPLPNRRVEWILPDPGVGAIVEVDESGWRSSRGHKVDSRFAITHTNNFDHTLTRGTDDPDDDIHLKRGQTWCVITSSVEGETHVIACVPAIHNWEEHKAFAVKIWSDVAWSFPPDAANRIGTEHQLVTQVKKHSDGSPLPGHAVTYEIASGPEAMLKPGDKQTATVMTDDAGRAEAVLVQAEPVAGANEIAIRVVRPAEKSPSGESQILGVGRMVKTWQAPKIDITKTAPARAIINQSFDYAIVVRNPGAVSARNVMVTDTLPEGIAYVSSRPEADAQGRKLTWSLGELDAGAARELQVTVQSENAGTFTNSVAVKADDGLSDEARAETVVTEPQLKLTKTAPKEVILCDPIEYVFTVTNEGEAPATNVRLVDELPEGLTYQDQGRIEAEVGTVQAGQSLRRSFNVMASKTGEYTNTARVTGDGGLSAEDSATTTVRVPVLAITKTGPANRFVGRPVTFEITVTNKGDAVAKNTVLTDTVPEGVDVREVGDDGKLARGKITWMLGDLKPDASRRVTVTFVARQPGQLRNTATATAYCAEASGEATTQVEGIPAILLECVDLDDPIEVGTNVTYRITVTNQGSAPGTGIAVEATLPAEMEFVSAKARGDHDVDGRTITFAPVARLAPQAEAVFEVVAKGVKTGDVRFAVRLNSDQMTSPVSETESTRVYSGE